MKAITKESIKVSNDTQIHKNIDLMLKSFPTTNNTREIENKAIKYLEKDDNINLSFNTPQGKRIVHLALGLSEQGSSSLELLKNYLENNDRKQSPNADIKAFSEIGKNSGLMTAEFYKATTIVGNELAKEYNKVIDLFQKNDYLKKLSNEFSKEYTNTNTQNNTNTPIQKDTNTTQNNNVMNTERKTVGYGTLTNYGVAPYKHNKENENSFFIELEKKNGEKKEIWGVELEGALQNSNKQIGDKIKIDHIGKVNVQVPQITKDNDGKVIALKMISTERNSFEITDQTSLKVQNNTNTQTQIDTNAQLQNNTNTLSQKDTNTQLHIDKNLTLKDIAESSIMLKHKQLTIDELLNTIINKGSNNNSMLVYGGLVYPYLGYDVSLIKKDNTNTTSLNDFFNTKKIEIPTVLLDAVGERVVPKKLDYEEFSKLAMGEVLTFPRSGVKYGFDLSTQTLYSNLITKDDNKSIEIQKDGIKSISNEALNKVIPNVDGQFTFFNKSINSISSMSEDSLKLNVPDRILNSSLNEKQKSDLLNSKAIELKNASIGGLELATVKLIPVDNGNGTSIINYNVGSETRELKASDVRMNYDNIEASKKNMMIQEFSKLESKLLGIGSDLNSPSSSLAMLKNYEVLSEKIKVIDFKLPEVNKTTPDHLINTIPDYANDKNYKIEKHNKLELVESGKTQINDLKLVVMDDKIAIIKSDKLVDHLKLTSENYESKKLQDIVIAGKDVSLIATNKPYLLDDKMKEIGVKLNKSSEPGLAERSLIPSVISGYKISKSEKNELIKNSKVDLSNKSSLSIISINGKSLLIHNNEKGVSIVPSNEKINRIEKNNLVDKLDIKKSFGLKL